MPDLSNTRERPPVLREEVEPRRIDAEVHAVAGRQRGHAGGPDDEPHVADVGVDERLVAEELDVLDGRAKRVAASSERERERLGPDAARDRGRVESRRGRSPARRRLIADPRARRPSPLASSRVGKRFIGGLPMKPATNAFAGRS